jgi:hypothetical protein
LKNLTKYSNLRTLKFAGNLVKEYDDLTVLVRQLFTVSFKLYRKLLQN